MSMAVPYFRASSRDTSECFLKLMKEQMFKILGKGMESKFLSGFYRKYDKSPFNKYGRSNRFTTSFTKQRIPMINSSGPKAFATARASDGLPFLLHSLTHSL